MAKVTWHWSTIQIEPHPFLGIPKPSVLPLWLLTESVTHCKRVSEGKRQEPDEDNWKLKGGRAQPAHSLSVSRELPNFLLGGAVVVLLYSVDFEAFTTLS